ncbi:MAG: terminase large subunit [Deltaproteobacteria bacterium]|nr:terminase large subunit [Deltaproteobacteria bacterium]
MAKERNIAEKYIDDVLKDRILVCEHVRRAVERHVRDLETGVDRGLVFKPQKGEHALKFFNFLRHYKGEWAGKPFVLSPWQAFIIYVIFGWYKSDGTRRFNYAYIEVARKNGKTTLAAAIALYLLIADGEPAAEIFSIATKYGQAYKTLEEAKGITSKSVSLKKRLGVSKHSIYDELSMSKFIALAADAKKEDSHNPHGVINDEYHAAPNDHMYNVMKSAMGARRQPLLATITTAGFNINSACFLLRKTCVDVLKGIKQQDNMFAIIFTLDQDDDWHDESTWIKANPNLDISVKLSYIRNEYKSALNTETEVVNFKTKNLNTWTSSATQWIDDSDWTACNLGKVTKEMIPEFSFAGLDLAFTTDIVGTVILFEKEGLFHLKPFFWIPEKKMKERSDFVDYELWSHQGYIKVIPGPAIDNDTLISDLMEIYQEWKVKSIGFDRWAMNISGVSKALKDEGLVINPFGQGWQSMSFPSKELEKMVLQKIINHEGNPVLRWMNTNVFIKRNPAGDIKIDKDKSQDKVDGMVATVMAIGEYLTWKMTADQDINELYKYGF